ncbi:MAG: dockerin type I domain-containing protein [Planctomycetota bacterium]
MIERLSERAVMASDWTNLTLPLDVDQSGRVTASDALRVINWINRVEDTDLPLLRDEESPWVDTSGDGAATALDALLIINALDRYISDPVVVGNWDRAEDPNGNGVILHDSVTFIGQARTGMRAELRGGDGRVLDSQDLSGTGRIELMTSVSPGIHDFQIVVTDPLGQTAEIARRVRRGDIILDWNATVLNVVREWTGTSDDPYQGRIVPSEPPRVARNLAMIHTAMFDAVAMVEGVYETYLSHASLSTDASPEAAAASAAFTVATSLYPDADSMGYWNATLDESLRGIAQEDEKRAGMELGRVVGQRMLDARDRDGTHDEFVYTHGDQPGDWQRTFPGYLPPLVPQWQFVDPFVVEDVTDFRPEAPPPVTSQAYAASVDEVMRFGSLDSEIRTADQTEIAIFWADGGGTFTPPGHWNQIAADVAIERDQFLLENARLFAMLNLGLADAAIASWDAKYHYDLWRPIDAIQRADADGNSQTVQDESWRPLLISPPFPTYTSGHSTFSGAADAVLTTLLGDGVSFASQTDSQSALGQRPLDPNLVVTRSFDSFRHAAEEAGLSRIYGGIHFDFDNTNGLEAGRAIGERVVSSVFARI